ncbi:Hypothetical predicted protein, partial [Paramuricea clavata]
MFPVLIGGLVPEGDKNWENLLNLLHIEEILFAPVTSVLLAAYLAILRILKSYILEKSFPNNITWFIILNKLS